MGAVARRIDKDSVVIQSNVITEAKYDFTVLETNIFLSAISSIRQNDDENTVYKIFVKDIVRDDLNLSDIYRRVQDAIINVKKFQIIIKHPETHENEIISVFGEKAVYKYGQGVIELSFSRSILPYIKDLTRDFTSFGLHQILQFQSAYTQRIYMLLKQFQSTGWRIVALDDLRFMLMLEDKYELYGHLKDRVIKQAQKEMEKSDIPFTVREIKEGRKVTKLEFTFEKSARKARNTTPVKPEKAVKQKEEKPVIQYNRQPSESKLIKNEKKMYDDLHAVGQFQEFPTWESRLAFFIDNGWILEGHRLVKY